MFFPMKVPDFCRSIACPGQRTNIFYPYSYRLEQRVKKTIKRKLDCEYHFFFLKKNIYANHENIAP